MVNGINSHCHSEDGDLELDEDLEVVRNEGDQVLHLNYRGLHSLPRKLTDQAESFSNLTRIYLKRNHLKILPEEISKLGGLVELYLHSNQLVKLPDGLCLLKNLESLDVSNNELSHLPIRIEKLQALEKLHVSNNKLKTLPRTLGKLKALKVLEVMNNELLHLPVEIEGCLGMTRLLVDRNKLQWLPQQLCRLEKLEEISACGNHLLCLPLDLGNMPSLKSVYVDNNPYLHAIPVSLESQEIGFNSCGSRNYSPNDFEQTYKHITIKHSDAQSKDVFLPREILFVGDRSCVTVASLIELAMQTVYRKHGNDIKRILMPYPLNTLCFPLTKCLFCKTPMYTLKYPIIFESPLQKETGPLYMGYGCNSACVRRTAITHKYRTVFPKIGFLYSV